jgi:hypothetical protein
MASPEVRKLTLEWESVHLYGEYGMLEMNLYLINQSFHHFFRLSLWLSTGSICGLFSGRWSNAGTWILGATVAFGIFTADSGIGLIED